MMDQRLIGWQRCDACHMMQRACWTTACVGPGECAYCGAMACAPVGPQVLARDLNPERHAEAILGEWLEARQAHTVQRMES